MLLNLVNSTMEQEDKFLSKFGVVLCFPKHIEWSCSSQGNIVMNSEITFPTVVLRFEKLVSPDIRACLHRKDGFISLLSHLCKSECSGLSWNLNTVNQSYLSFKYLLYQSHIQKRKYALVATKLRLMLGQNICTMMFTLYIAQESLQVKGFRIKKHYPKH